MAIRPLIKKDQKGVLYARPPSVEAKIRTVLGCNDWAALAQRARITDPKAPDYLPSECLVHLIRDAIRRGDQRIATLLMPPLLVRCEANLLKMVPDSAMRDAEAVREEILSSFQMLFTDDAAEDALDYYECRFGRAFKALRIDHVRAEISRRKELTDLPEVTNEHGDTMLDDEALARLSRAARIGPSQEDGAYLPQVLKAVNLPPGQRRAVVLRRIIGHEEEVVAKECDVGGRTIRNRLSRADERLKTFKEDL
jgi:sigma-70-like protein